mmetsp:Transcript_1172/g.1920  ORF Transcript_1172/g.1920 Transcript_1172/m.1920 type:complete len:90 (-) Transcript_1172:367-636(-)
MSITVKVLLFASAREAAGNVSSINCTLDGELNTNALRQTLANQYPGLASLVLDESNITLALNEEYIAQGEVKELTNGDVVALIPPISGG